MRASASLLPLLLAAPALAQNQTFLAGLVGQLSAVGLNQLIKIATSINSTTEGQQLLANISNGSPYVLFAPNDAAWSAAPSSVTGDQDTLADVFSYHIVPGNFSQSSTHYPNVTLGETLYDDAETVHLEGNKPQVVAWSIREDGKTHVLNQRNDSTVVNSTSFGNLTILVVDHVLAVPENFEDTIPTNADSLTAFEAVLRDATLSFYNATTDDTDDVSFFDAFNEGYRGFTLFSPNNDALGAANQTLESFSDNRTAINNILFNHFINASTIYSPLLAGSQSYTTAAGETLTFSINSTGQYVTSGNVTAKIVQPDVLLPNGVVHIVDRVLLNTDSNPSAASSALSSASTAATAVTSQTAPIGFSQTQTLGGPSGSATNTNGSNAAAGLTSVKREHLMAIAVAVGGVMVGGWMTLF